MTTARARVVSLAWALSVGALTSAANAEEPWTDADPKEPASRYPVGDFGLRADAEYRAQFVSVTPIALDTDKNPNASWIEHRLRLDAGADYKDKVRLITSIDAMNGVLWGDNGDFGGTPSSNMGANAATRNPNTTAPCITLRGGDPLLRQSYGYAPCAQESIVFRKLYGEVILPFGLLRVGRQTVSPGTGVQASDGDGRPNRFGVSGTGSVVDRFLFATKPLEGLKPKEQRDTTEEGLVVAGAYDRWVTDSPQVPTQAVHQLDGNIRYKAKKYALGEDLFASLYYAHRWDEQYRTHINSVGTRAMSRFGPIYVGIDSALNVGSTREVAASYKVVANDPVVDQAVLQGGARAVVRLDQKFWTAYFEFDFASGDRDPNARTPLTQFVWSEDNNVGLLLFERILAFQTATAAASSVELLRRLGAKAFPADSVSTRGSFSNAFAIFPQFDVRPHPTVLFRGGALVAWAAEPVADPIASLKARDGLTIKDDLVNYVGGKPGNFYGVELDGRFQFRFIEHFLFDLEGAILFPGNALQNVDGNAVRSVLVQARTTFIL